MTSELALVVSVFLACTVEAVEALTVVLAIGITRGWRASVYGVAAALLTLMAIVVALGPALSVIPLQALRLVVGTLLLIFGLQWLRKAILRAAGRMALHDELAIFRRTEEMGRTSATDQHGFDGYAFTLCFKAVLLEGLEVAFIVLTFGTNAGRVLLAAISGVAAVIVVCTLGVVVRGPLGRVPENQLKFVVGTLLTTFGMFWSGEGVGVNWPGADAALIPLAGFVLLVALGYVALLRVSRPREAAA
jgi:uncharacterized membrane protein